MWFIKRAFTISVIIPCIQLEALSHSSVMDIAVIVLENKRERSSALFPAFLACYGSYHVSTVLLDFRAHSINKTSEKVLFTHISNKSSPVQLKLLLDVEIFLQLKENKYWYFGILAKLETLSTQQILQSIDTVYQWIPAQIEN